MKLKTRLIIQYKNPEYDRTVARLAMGGYDEPKWLYLGPGSIIEVAKEDVRKLVGSGQCDPACSGSENECAVNETVTGVDGTVNPSPRAFTEKRRKGLEMIYRQTAIAQLSSDQTRNAPNQVFEHYKQRLEEAGINTEGMDKYDLLMTFQARKNGQRVIPAEEWNQASATGDD